MRCAFAYMATQKAPYLAQALKYWHASLDDDQALGDGLGCKAGVSTSWQGWNGDPPAPPVILTVTHDTGYPMRWYGPDIALTYDWLHDAPGVDAGLLGQTRTCLTAWNDYYTDRGYHHDEAGANYAPPNVNQLDAVLAGLSSNKSASFAAFQKQAQSLKAGAYVYNAIAEIRTVTPADFRAQSPEPPRWYLARGTRAVYARTSWKPDALWSVFTSAPAVVSDHTHYSASNFVLNRGADALLVDPSRYGEVEQNAGVLGASVVRGDKQSYVVASSAVDGASPATMTYGVPGGAASRHVVFDAPEDSNGESVVGAAVQGSRCVLTITAGKGFAGRPLMFAVAGVPEGCKVTESVDVTPVGPSGAGGSGGGGTMSSGDTATSSGAGGSGGAGTGDGSSGCGCRVGEGPESGTAALGLLLGLAGLSRRRRARRE